MEGLTSVRARRQERLLRCVTAQSDSDSGDTSEEVSSVTGTSGVKAVRTRTLSGSLDLQHAVLFIRQMTPLSQTGSMVIAFTRQSPCNSIVRRSCRRPLCRSSREPPVEGIVL